MTDHSTALVPMEAALPAHLIAGAKSYMAEARAPRTREAYRRAWALFADWCERHQRQALPANPETVAAWLVALANGDEDGKPRARKTINQYLSAVIVAHRAKGHTFDRKHQHIAETWKGIVNSKAKEPNRAANPLVAPDLRDLLRGLRFDIPSDARDAAMLSLGFAAALRRSEIVGLDWRRLGSGSGFVTVDERGVVVTLATSKSSQAEAVTIVVPVEHMPTAIAALETWAEVAGLRPGDAVFRPVDQRQIIGASRLTDRSVSRILKSRVRALLILRGKTKSEADELVERFSGHSMRAGYATTAAANDVSVFDMQRQTRHKSLSTLSGYVREADKWKKNGLKGIGF